MTLQNFGKNVRFSPAELFAPIDKNAVLTCLERHRGRKIRAHGGLHSWSEAAECNDVVLDLRHLDHVALGTDRDGGMVAEIDAGCTVDSVLDYLRIQCGNTLPTYGIIGKQTIAGAISTATHGSGRASLSHYVQSICVAAYDNESGKAVVHEWHGGEALRAARCAVGCMGVVLSVRMRVQADYLIEERTNWFDRFDDVLDQELDYPRQQFYLVPWSWRWFGQHRRAIPRESGPVPNIKARLRRVLRLVAVDFLFHGALKLLAGILQWWAGVRWLYRRVFPLIAKSDTRVIDHARHILMMRHDLFTHVEMELFVPREHVRHAAEYVEWVLRCCGGESLEMPKDLRHDKFGRNVAGEIAALRGSYVHDYLVTFRRVLADDALISMTAGIKDEASYAISLITYQRDHTPFLAMAKFMAATMASAYRARPHWGKICPLDADEIATLYPELPGFRAHCASVDSEQAFVNDFARRVLGF
jgi:hypothetical protein